MKKYLKYIIILIILDALIILPLVFFSPEAAIGIAILTILTVLFFTLRLGYVYFLIIWMPYEGIIFQNAESMRVFRLIGLVVILILAFSKFLLAGEKIKLPHKRITYPLAAFYLWCGLAVFTSVNPLISMVEFLKLTTFIAMFLLAYNLVRSTAELKKVFYFFLFATAPIYLAAFYQYFIKGLMRVSGIAGNANTLGMHCLLIIMVALILWKLSSKSAHRILILLPALAITIPVLVLSGSRASILGFIIFLGIYLILTKRFLILTFIIAIGIFSIFHILGSREMLIDVLIKSRMVSGTTGRTILWEGAIPLIRDNWLTGVGLGGVPDVYYNYIQQSHPIVSIYLKGVISRGVIHNGYLQKTAELGLIGFTVLIWAMSAYLVFLVRTISIKTNRLLQNTALILISFFIARIVHSFFESSILIGPLSVEGETLVFMALTLKYLETESEIKKPETRVSGLITNSS